MGKLKLSFLVYICGFLDSRALIISKIFTKWWEALSIHIFRWNNCVRIDNSQEFADNGRCVDMRTSSLSN
ncbi:unnamed protein product [Moneuplotes crassus]|uniref:Uncharacterized protein n=1 Tax=Euplotes crassus TaxID=5936 RepID=A0AAD1X7M5_EUPCR|nr:unnamed protein product [Moneuplotes crassus]